MCRICGRMVRCIFDSMPSKAQTAATKRSFGTISRSSQSKSRNQYASSGELLRRAMNIHQTTTQLPPTFLLPLCVNLHQASTQQSASSPTQFENTKPNIPPSVLQTPPPAAIETDTILPSQPRQPTTPLVLSTSLLTYLPALSLQTPHYITAHIHSFPYLLTQGDTLRLPFHMPAVSPGDILRLTRASLVGSRDYTLKAGTSRPEMYDGKPSTRIRYLDERLFVCRARVLGVESGPMLVKEKTKRRNRKVKTVKSKHRFTVLRIVEVRLNTLEDLRGEASGALLEEGGAEITQVV